MNFIILYLMITGIIGFSSFFYIIFIYKNRNNLWLSLFLLSASFYVFGYSLELMSPDVETLFFWLKFEYIGISTFASIGFITALEYYNFEKSNNMLKIFLMTISGLIFLAVFTNESHHLFYKSLQINKIGDLSVTIFERGILNYLESSYNFVIGVLAISILIRAFSKTTKYYRKFMIVIIIPSITVLILFVLYMLGYTPYGLDIMAFTISTAIYAIIYTIFIFEFLEVSSIYRDKVFQYSPSAILVLNSKYIIIDENNTAYKIFGNFIGKNIEMINKTIKEKIDNIVNETTKIENILINQSIFNVRISRYRKNNTYGYILNFNDITNLKDIETQLIKINREKDLLIAGISHELRTPLNGIKGMAQLIVTTEHIEKKDKYANNIVNASTHLEILITNLLSSSQAVLSNESQEFLLNEIFDEVKNAFFNELIEKRIYLFYYIQKDIPTVLIGNKKYTRQILLNLISNAVKFTNEGGGCIWVNKIKNSDNKIKLEFVIKDTGIGIKTESQSRVFEQFFRDEEVSEIIGTGLGLPIVRNMIQSMNGEISLNSEYKVGTEIKVNLEYEFKKQIKPIKAKKRYKIIVITKIKLLIQLISRICDDYKIESVIIDDFEKYQIIENDINSSDKIVATSDFDISKIESLDSKEVFLIDLDFKPSNKRTNIYELDSKKILEFFGLEMNFPKVESTSKLIPKYSELKILIAEDNLLNIEILSEVLNLMGQKYDVGTSGKEVKELLGMHKYDLIFMDLSLGKDSGLKLGEFIKSKYKTKLVAVTASITEKIRNRALSIGFDEFIRKPYDLNDIFYVFEKYFPNKKIDSKKTFFNEKKQKFIDILIKNLNTDLYIIEECIKTNGFSEIQHIAHKRKGGAAQVKLEKLNTILNFLEKYAKEENSSLCKNELLKLRNEIENISKL